MSKTIRLRELAIGNSIITLIYSLRTHTPCILEKPQKPFEFTEELCKYPFPELNTGCPMEIWDRLTFVLGMSGLLLFPDNIQSIREEDNVEVITKRNRKTVIECDNVIRFDTTEDEYVNVYDYFWCRTGSAHNVDILRDEESEFVSTVLFPPRNSVSRDAIACSRMLYKDLYEVDLSSNIARLKTISMMRSGGIKGSKNGTLPNGEQEYIPPRLEWEKRLIKKIYTSGLTLDEVVALEQEKGYAWKLLESTIPPISTLQG